MEDSNGAINVSAASPITFYFTKPGGTTVTKTGSLYSDGTDGIVKYLTTSGDIDEEGLWSVYVYVDLGSEELTSSTTTFLVESFQAWETELVELLRVMLGDLSETPTYSDDRLRRVLLSAAHMVNSEISFDTTYVVDIAGQSISPDPTGIPDTNFLNLVAAKAACLVERGETKSALQQGFMAKDGMGMVIDIRSRGAGYIDMAKYKKDWCSMYDQMKNDYLNNGASELGEAVMGPFRVHAYNWGRQWRRM